jgi:2-iminobutanoate/2-iminopropanoate deaminase
MRLSQPIFARFFIMTRSVIQTSDAPAAIGPYSQAVKLGSMVFCSGQIGLDPATGNLVAGGFEAQVEQAIKNLAAVAKESGGSLDHAVKLTLFLTDLANFGVVNEAMKRSFKAPYPARSTIGVASLPKGAEFEIEAILVV